MGHLALGDQVMQQPELLLGGDEGVDPVQLEQVEPFEAQSTQAQFALLAEVLGPAHRQPLTGALTGEARLGGDDQAVGVGVECLEDEAFAHLGTVGVGGVDEVDTHVDRPAQDLDASVAVGRFAPDPGSR